MKENVQIKIEFKLNQSSLIHATASKITTSKCKLVFKRKKEEKEIKKRKEKEKEGKKKVGGLKMFCSHLGRTFEPTGKICFRKTSCFSPV